MIRVLLLPIILFTGLAIAGAQKSSPFQYYHTLGMLDSSQQRILQKNHFIELKLTDGRYIDPGKTELPDSAFLVKSIQELYPSPHSTTIGVLDWEGQAYHDLYDLPATHPKFKAALLQFQRLLRIARQLRPNIKWGIYGIPYVAYWNRDSTWKNSYKKILPLLKNIDVLMPSLYDYYDDGTPYTDDSAYVSANTILALEAGKKVNKPVYAFIWQRWFEGNEKIGLQLIPEKQFAKHLDLILNARYAGNRIAGFIWFDGPKYFYRTKPGLAAMDAKSMNLSMPAKETTLLEDSIIKKYSGIILQRVKNRKP